MIVSAEWNIRKIELQDNVALARVLREVLIEMGVPKVGTAYADPELDSMFQAYDTHRSSYFVVVRNGQIMGGAGIAPLSSADSNVCELQKMYFLPESRNLGLGKKMIETCLEFAKNNHFKQCYLETMPDMNQAQGLYKRMGFEYIDKPMGNTGHFSCPVWMLKSLF